MEKEALAEEIEVDSEVETVEKVVDQKCMLQHVVNVATRVKYHSDQLEHVLFSAATVLVNRKVKKVKVLVVDHENEVLIAHALKTNALTFARLLLRITKQ